MTITAQAPATLPAVQCAPWCRDGSGHTDASHVEDQWCSSEDHTIPLTAEALVQYDRGVHGLGDVAVYASREAYSIRPLIKVVHNGNGGDASVVMTTEEARELANALLILAGTVDHA